MKWGFVNACLFKRVPAPGFPEWSSDATFFWKGVPAILVVVIGGGTTPRWMGLCNVDPWTRFASPVTSGSSVSVPGAQPDLSSHEEEAWRYSNSAALRALSPPPPISVFGFLTFIPVNGTVVAVLFTSLGRSNALTTGLPLAWASLTSSVLLLIIPVTCDKFSDLFTLP